MLPAELKGEVSATSFAALPLEFSAAVCANCSEDPPALCMLPKGVELPLSAGTALELGGADSGAASGRGKGPEMTPALYSVCKLRST